MGEPVEVQDGVEFLGGAGFGVEEALGADAAEGDEGGGGDVGFHSFGDGPQAEGVGEADDGPDDGQVVGVVSEVADEAAVDFQDVDGQRFELGEGAVPGAEVVDRDLDPEGAEPVQGGQRLLGVPDECLLGDLQGQVPAVQTGVAQGAADGVDEVGGDQFRG